MKPLRTAVLGIIAVAALVSTAAPAQARSHIRFVAQGDTIVMIASGLPRVHVDCDMTRTFEGPIDSALGSLATGYPHKRYTASGRGPTVRIRTELLPRAKSYPVDGSCIDQRSRILARGSARVHLR